MRLMFFVGINGPDQQGGLWLLHYALSAHGQWSSCEGPQACLCLALWENACAKVWE